MAYLLEVCICGVGGIVYWEVFNLVGVAIFMDLAKRFSSWSKFFSQLGDTRQSPMYLCLDLVMPLEFDL